MHKDYKITINNVVIDAKVSVPYSNCIRIEYFDATKQVLSTGYKSEHLGVCETPIVFMQHIEYDVARVIEGYTKKKVQHMTSGELIYTEQDILEQGRWKDLLRGDTDELEPKFKQLTLF